jgi:hypothetical protein
MRIHPTKVVDSNKQASKELKKSLMMCDGDLCKNDKKMNENENTHTSQY